MEGWSPLLLALNFNKDENLFPVCKLLLQAGAISTLKQELHFAIVKGHVNIVREMIKQGVQPMNHIFNESVFQTCGLQIPHAFMYFNLSPFLTATLFKNFELMQ